MNNKIFLLYLLIWLSFPKIISATDKLTPGGLVYAQSFWGDNAKPMTENRMKIRVTTYPGEQSSYFWSQQFFYAGSNEGGYVGLQTGGIQKGLFIGKQMIFSVWNVRNAEPGKGAICEPFTGEGDGMKCSIVYNWKEGEDYIASVKVSGKKLLGSVIEVKTGKTFLIGKMPFPKGYNNLSHGALIWVEYFGDVIGNCNQTPLQTATFTPEISNGLNGRISNVTFGNKCNNARGDIETNGSSVIFTTGGEIKR